MKTHALKAGHHTLTVRLPEKLSGEALARAKDEVRALFMKYRPDLNLSASENPVNWEQFENAAQTDPRAASEMVRLLEALNLLSPLKQEHFGILLEGNGGHAGVTNPATSWPLYFVRELDAFAYARTVLRDTHFGWEIVRFGRCYGKAQALA